MSYDECRPAGAANSLMIVDSIIGQSYAKRRFGEIWEERLDEEVARLGLLGVLVRTVSPAANEHPGKCRECLETEQIRPAERQIAVLGGPKVVKFRLLPSIRNRSYSARASVRRKAPLDPLSFAAGDTVLTAGPTTQPHAAQTQRAPTDHRWNSHGDGSRERKETKEPGTERDKTSSSRSSSSSTGRSWNCRRSGFCWSKLKRKGVVMHPPLQQLARPARRRVAAPGGKANGVSADEAPSIGRRPAKKALADAVVVPPARGECR